jgi:hypothetical protein
LGNYFPVTNKFTSHYLLRFSKAESEQGGKKKKTKSKVTAGAKVEIE